METVRADRADRADRDEWSAGGRGDREVLVYLDVDGPLNPYAAKATRRPLGYETHRLLPESHVRQSVEMGTPRGRVKPLRVWLNPDHGQLLRGMLRKLTAAGIRARLVWATTWEHEANTMIAPLIGLGTGVDGVEAGDLEVLEWDSDNHKRWTATADGPLYFKTPEILAHAAGRAFAWLDDEIGRADRLLVEREHSGAGAGANLLLQIDPHLGLKRADLDTVADWARKVTRMDSDTDTNGEQG